VNRLELLRLPVPKPLSLRLTALQSYQVKILAEALGVKPAQVLKMGLTLFIDKHRGLLEAKAREEG
jgi:hypothetical protein